MSYFDKPNEAEPTPRIIRAGYRPEELGTWLSALTVMSVLAGVAGAILGGVSLADAYRADASGAVTHGWAIVIGSLAGGIGAAGFFAFLRGVLMLLSEIRNAAVWSHNLAGEQAPAAVPEKSA